MPPYSVCTNVCSLYENGEKQFILGIIFCVIMYRSYKILKLMHFLAQSVDLLHLKKYATFVFTIALTFAGILMPPVPTVGSKTRYVLRSYV